MWLILPFLKPKHETARRFQGKVGWNQLLVSKSDTLHSISFKSTNWIELKGFEMLCGDFSYKITYTITKGQGVMGRRVTKGTSFVRAGSLLNPVHKVTFTVPKRLEPSQWYTINVVMDIHEYDMHLITSTGTDGVPFVETDCGIVIEYRAGLESGSHTTNKSGQIAGILFSQLRPEDEHFFTQEKLRRRSRSTVSSQIESAVGSDGEVDLPEVLKGESVTATDDTKRGKDGSTDQQGVSLPNQALEMVAQYPISPAVQTLVPQLDTNRIDENSTPQVKSYVNQAPILLSSDPSFFNRDGQPIQKPLISQRPSHVQESGLLQPTVNTLTPVMRTEDILRNYMHTYDRK